MTMENHKASTELQIKPAEQIRLATDVAGVCSAIVKKTAVKIKGRGYVKVEGWQSIATAHGCVAGSRDVEQTETGIRAIGEVRRADTGTLIAQAEGFVGNDERMWANRSEYARRAMAQTRAISRACRSAFAHVVVLIDERLSTTPAEEMQEEPDEPPMVRVPNGFKQAKAAMQEKPAKASEPADWTEVGVYFGEDATEAQRAFEGVPLGELRPDQLEWAFRWMEKRMKSELTLAVSPRERAMMDGLLAWKRERRHSEKPNPMSAKQFQEERERQQKETEADINDWNPAA